MLVLVWCVVVVLVGWHAVGVVRCVDLCLLSVWVLFILIICVVLCKVPNRMF